MKPNNNAASSFQFPKIPSHLIGESALIDKETGQVYWQGGRRDAQSLLSSSSDIANSSSNDSVTTYHLKSSILTGLLVLSLLSLVVSWLRNYLYNTTPNTTKPNKLFYVLKLVTILSYIIPIPKLHHPLLASIIIMFYFIEAYTCNTRKYLNNCMDSHEFEKYMNDIELSKPEVEWKVRCFHYEDRVVKTKGSKEENDGSFVSNNGNKWNKKKVITNEVAKQYNYTRFEHKTIANIVSQSKNITRIKPFVKLTLSKVLLLSNKKTKDDYFQQQSSFVSIEGRKDTFAEYSTKILVHGFQPKLLAIRQLQADDNASNMSKLIQSMVMKPYVFWIFTCLGLTLPFRIMFHRYCDELRITLIKETFNEANNNMVSSSTSSNTVNAWFINQKYNSLLQSLSSSISTIISNTNSSSSSMASRKDDDQELFRNFMRQYYLYPTNTINNTINTTTSLDSSLSNIISNVTTTDITMLDEKLLPVETNQTTSNEKLIASSSNVNNVTNTTKNEFYNSNTTAGTDIILENNNTTVSLQNKTSIANSTLQDMNNSVATNLLSSEFNLSSPTGSTTKQNQKFTFNITLDFNANSTNNSSNDSIVHDSE